MRQLIILVGLFCVVSGQSKVAEFCKNYASCRTKARSQLLECTGGFAQMILSKYDANITITDAVESFKICTAELPTNIEKSICKDYAHIDEKIVECTNEASPNSLLEKTQELICQAVYNETDLSAMEIQGIGSDAQCYQVYEADLHKCELIRDCCPSFESCREKIEKESGIGVKEHAIVTQLQKCFSKSGVEIEVNGEESDEEDEVKSKDDKGNVDIRFAPTHPPPHRFDPSLPTATPVPRIKNGTVMENGVFIFKSHNIPGKEKKRHRKHKKQRRLEEKQKLEQEQKDAEAKLNSELVADEVAKRLQEFQEIQSKTPTPQTEAPQTEAPKEHHDDFQIPASKQKSTNKQILILNELLCKQFAECEEIVKKEEHECELLFGGHTDDNGIEDTEIRAIFLNNSKTEDQQIRRKCLENVDVETQKHLAYLKQQISRQNEECAFENFSENLELDGCQKLELLTELSSLKRANKDPLINTIEKCKQRLDGFRQKCQSLQSCCPQRISCELTNHSSEIRKYGDINSQLKMEQTLCEARLQRIRDGINAS